MSKPIVNRYLVKSIASNKKLVIRKLYQTYYIFKPIRITSTKNRNHKLLLFFTFLTLTFSFLNLTSVYVMILKILSHFHFALFDEQIYQIKMQML